MSLWSLAPVRVTKDGLSGRVAVGAGAVAAHAPEMGAPVTAGLAAGWLAGK